MTMAKQEGFSFMQFKQKFDSEEACRDHLFKIRWPHGFCCPKCGSLRRPHHLCPECGTYRGETYIEQEARK
jgi:ribosomal protein L32